MFKKLSLFLGAIAIGILSIFNSISTKNTAEPQYFLENTQVKKTVVETNNYYDFYFDKNVLNFDESLEQDNSVQTTLFNTTTTTKLYYINKNDNYVEYTPQYGYSSSIIFSKYKNYENEISNSFMISQNGPTLTIQINNIEKVWYITQGSLIATNIKGFRLENVNLAENQTLESINNLLIPYIGTLTEIQQPIPPLEQINTLVNDIVNWFTSIFNGLGNVFYDPTANKLTAWGTVMFIGVAIMLISMALKWVISLIRGV